jgi:hypothetical protein
MCQPKIISSIEAFLVETKQDIIMNSQGSSTERRYNKQNPHRLRNPLQSTTHAGALKGPELC